MTRRQLNAVVGDTQYPNYPREEFYLHAGLKISFLQQIFLCFALIGRLLVFGCLQFFHQVAMPVTMQPGLIAVFAKLGGDIMPVKLETRINKEARKAAAYQAYDEQQRCNAVFHAAKVVLTDLMAIFIISFRFGKNNETCHAAGSLYLIYI